MSLDTSRIIALRELTQALDNLLDAESTLLMITSVDCDTQEARDFVSKAQKSTLSVINGLTNND